MLHKCCFFSITAILAANGIQDNCQSSGKYSLINTLSAHCIRVGNEAQNRMVGPCYSGNISHKSLWGMMGQERSTLIEDMRVFLIAMGLWKEI